MPASGDLEERLYHNASSEHNRTIRQSQTCTGQTNIHYRSYHYHHHHTITGHATSPYWHHRSAHPKRRDLADRIYLITTATNNDNSDWIHSRDRTLQENERTDQHRADSVICVSSTSRGLFQFEKVSDIVFAKHILLQLLWLLQYLVMEPRRGCSNTNGGKWRVMRTMRELKVLAWLRMVNGEQTHIISDHIYL